MSTTPTHDIIDIVYSLNQQLSQSLIDKSLTVTFDTDGCNEGISFMGTQIWTDCDDPRHYDEASDTYEPLKPFLLRQITTLASEILAAFSTPGQ